MINLHSYAGVRALIQRALAPLLMSCVVGAMAQEAIPDFHQEPGLMPNRAYVEQSANEAIDPFSGVLNQHYVDVHLPGNGGFDLNVVRSYSSSRVVQPYDSTAATRTIAGWGWDVHFGRILRGTDTYVCLNRLGATTVDNPTLELPDGSRQMLTFTASGTPLMVTTQRWRAECHGAGTGLKVYSPDGVIYEMTKVVNVASAVKPLYSWYATKITDKNGNYATITYGAGPAPEIQSVTTNDGRQLSFTYDDSGLLSARLKSISGGGQTYNYNYQAVTDSPGQWFLTSVTRPDNTSWNYTYWGNTVTSVYDPASGNWYSEWTRGSWVMRSVTYPQGGTINYDYQLQSFDGTWSAQSIAIAVSTKDLSTGGPIATGGTADPAGHWGFVYGGNWNLGGLHGTQVDTPDGGHIQYWHVGPGNVNSGDVWKVGLLTQKIIVDASFNIKQQEDYTWDKQIISNEQSGRPGIFSYKADPYTYAPILTQKNILRDGVNHTTVYSNFDTYGNVGTVAETGVNGGSRVTTNTYYIDTGKWIVRQLKDQSVAGGRVTTRTFDGNGNLASVTQDGVTTSYVYDAAGNVSTKTAPRNLVTNYSGYIMGVPTTENQPESVTITRTVDANGNVSSETNGDGFKTTFVFDNLFRITSVLPPAGNTVQITYGTATKTATRGSLLEATSYDGFGRPVSVTTGGITRTYQYDALGRKTFESNPSSAAGTTYLYDGLNRVVRITHADSTYQQISYPWGYSGLKQVIDERGYVNSYSYRMYGNPDQQLLMGIAAALTNANVTISRDTRDLVTSVAQGGFTRNYGYNANTYLTSVTNPETSVTTYGRDAAGNMTTRTVGTSGTTVFTYDGHNRLATATYPGTTPAVTNTYNKRHKLLSASSSTGNRTLAYDNNGNLTSETLSIPADSLSFTAVYGYNANDQFSSITYPRSGSVVNYTPDVLGRPTQITGFVNSVTYWPSGQIQQISYANGTTTTYGQNSRLWPSTFNTRKGTDPAYIDSSYGYDGAGNLLSISDAADASYSRVLGYDGLNRVTTANGPWGSGSITYNGVGNITSQQLGSFGLSYTYDTSNKLTSISGSRAATYGYDAYGDVVSAAGNTYTYDDVPSLTCVNCADTVNRVIYTYDATGHRASVDKGGVKAYEMVSTSGNQLIEFTPSQSNKLIEYIYLGNKRVAQRQSNIKTPTTTAVSSSANPALLGGGVTFTATITGSSGPTGTVTFYDGASTLGSGTIAGGVATFASSALSAGAHNITAVYEGDTGNATSTSSVLIQYITAATSVSLVSASNPVNAGTPVLLTATVVSAGAGPTGNVTFMADGGVIGTAPLSGSGGTRTATLSHAFVTAGNFALTAAYSGDQENAASTSAPVAQVVIAVSTTTLGTSASPSAVGHAVTFTATVAGYAPTGTVTFKNGANTLGSVSLTGTGNTRSASFTSSALAQGSHSITAVYAGDAMNIDSISSVLTQVVNPVGSAASNTGLSSSSNPVAAGSPVVLTATVTGTAPTGFVTFKAGTSTLGVVPLSGVGNSQTVALTYTFSTAGSRVLTAVYSGDLVHASSTSASLSQGVSGTSTTTVRTSLTPSVVGGNVTFTATVVGSAPSGTVTFASGGTAIGTANLIGSGNTRVAALTVNALSVGVHSITASFPGNASNQASVSAAINQTVNQKITTTGLSSIAVSSPQGASVSFTATVVGVSPTGTVTFMDGVDTLGTGTLSGTGNTRTVTLTVNNLVVGSHSIRANYAGDASNAPSNSAILGQEITTAP